MRKSTKRRNKKWRKRGISKSDENNNREKVNDLNREISKAIRKGIRCKNGKIIQTIEMNKRA